VDDRLGRRDTVCITAPSRLLEIFQRRVFEPDDAWFHFLDTLAGQAAIAIGNAMLFSDLQRPNTDLTLAYDATIEGWARALDLRDKETEGHSRRVTELTEKLAMVLGVPPEQLVHIRRGALLHDTPAYTAGAGRQNGHPRQYPAQTRPVDQR
jgi:HD-GYP domain-containing protein (c-di-GMP phosphodiesterase class II)